MVYDVEKVVRDVRVALDQGGAASQLAELGDGDALALDEIIESKLEEAARRVVAQAPYRLLMWENAHSFGDAIYWGEDGSGWIVLPEDFLRLIVFEMSDWERACFQAIEAGTPEYDMQRSRRKGLRGSQQNPVCALSMRASGLVLEFYSSRYVAGDADSTAKVQRALYAPIPKIAESEDGLRTLDLPERCYQAIVYTAAALACSAYGAADKAALLTELAQGSLK